MKNKKLLFITSNRLGDAVLSTGILNAAIERFKPDSISIACGPIPAPLFTGVPSLTEIITLDKKEKGLHWLKLWARVVGQRWDVVVDVRNSLVSYLIFANHRFHFIQRRSDIHKTLQIAEMMGLTKAPAGKIFLTKNVVDEAARLLPTQPILALCPTANWGPKQWPAENFLRAAQQLLSGKLVGASVAIFGAENERAQSEELIRELSKQYKVIDLVGKTDPLLAAACLQRCALCIANDSGLMHIAAAIGTPTLGLFGPSFDVEYAPHGPRVGFVRGAAFHGLDKTPDPLALMRAIHVETVVEAAAKLL